MEADSYCFQMSLSLKVCFLWESAFPHPPGLGAALLVARFWRTQLEP